VINPHALLVIDMKCLITGASGFLGKHLLKELQHKGYEITALSSKSAPLLNPKYLNDFDGIKFDRIYHLAAYTRAGDFCETHGGEQWVVNQQLNTNILTWWQQKQSKAKFIALGTSASYPADVKMTEENYLKDVPVERFYAYAMTKRMLLVGLQSLAKQYNLKYVYAIPSVIYGPEYHLDGREKHFIYDIIFKIIKATKTGESVQLWGDGQQRRELIHVHDAVAGIETICNGPANEIYNLSSGEDHSIREFAKLVCDELKYDFAKVQFDESRYVGIRSKTLPIKKIETIGFKAQISLQQGLKETIHWCLENFRQ
jgi:GDP-L-fucose synthase